MKKISKIIRFYNTVKYLKFIQIQYRFFYIARKKIRKLYPFSYPLFLSSKSYGLQFDKSITSIQSYDANIFTFLNLSHQFKGKIDWNYSQHGKLWTYNLTYFDFLQQEGLPLKDGLALILGFIEQMGDIEDGLEPFPISLRGINWIKFLARGKIEQQKIDGALFAQYQILMDSLEYHLLGNHLLENGFSLLFGAYYFQDEKLYLKAKAILIVELKEQVLEDGAHFELSPMYHQIMLFRLFDCINLLQNNHWKDDYLLDLLNQNASLMLGWLNTVTFKNGNIPLLNDSANHIAPTTSQLNDYANRLNIECKTNKTTLSDSGYRKMHKEKYECIIDVGIIGPDYIPGHAHSDTFNFELYVNDNPFIVDTGLSTYETNARRTEERSTAAHNTVEIDALEQSEIWGGFRVAHRAKVVFLQESKDNIKALHDGYKKRLGALHQREFFFNDNSIRIIDYILSEKEHDAVARLHFHPDVKIKIVDNLIFANDTQIKVENYRSEIKTENYRYSPEFNKQFTAVVLEMSFRHKLDIEILL